MKQRGKEIDSNALNSQQRYRIVRLCNLAERFDARTGTRTLRDAQLLKVAGHEQRRKLLERILDEASNTQCNPQTKGLQTELIESTAQMLVDLAQQYRPASASSGEIHQVTLPSQVNAKNAEIQDRQDERPGKTGRAQRWWDDVKWLMSELAADARRKTKPRGIAT